MSVKIIEDTGEHSVLSLLFISPRPLSSLHFLFLSLFISFTSPLPSPPSHTCFPLSDSPSISPMTHLHPTNYISEALRTPWIPPRLRLKLKKITFAEQKVGMEGGEDKEEEEENGFTDNLIGVSQNDSCKTR